MGLEGSHAQGGLMDRVCVQESKCWRPNKPVRVSPRVRLYIHMHGSWSKHDSEPSRRLSLLFLSPRVRDDALFVGGPLRGSD